jgi:putative ABC transport system permease protein
MLRASLRNLVAHKLRLFLTALSIVLAVAFVAGTYVFTDSLRASLDTLIQQNQPDVTVRPAAADFSPEFQGAGEVLTVPTELTWRYRGRPRRRDGLPAGAGPQRGDPR